jgi:hypothetical protein
VGTGYLNQGRFAMLAQRASAIAVAFLLCGSSVLAPSVAAGASPTVAATGNQQGFSVAVSGNTAVVGAPGANNHSGIAHIWERGGGGQPWQQVVTLTDPRKASNDDYGWAVAVFSTNTATYVAIGGNEQNGKPDVVYVYEGSGKTWHRQARLFDSDGHSKDMFGSAMAISSTVLVVGAPAVSGNSGTVYIYKRSGQQWNQQATVTDPGDTSQDLFGRSVSTSGNEVLAGAVDTAYIFTNASGHSWTQTVVLRNPGSPKDNFGYGVYLDATTATIGRRVACPERRLGRR